MSISKLQLARHSIIDSVFCKKEFVRTKDLEIIIAHSSIPVSQRTIQKDLINMQEDPPFGYSAPIKWDSKKKAYYYADRDFTIQNFGLKEEDIKALLFYEKTLNQFKGIKLFENVLKAIEKVIDRMFIGKKIKQLIADRTLIQTEKVPYIKGLDLIDPIIKAIFENQKIIFSYTKFDKSEPKIRELCPLLLKEDKHFWYVIGLPGNDKIPKTFALDRISNLRITNNYFIPPKIDFDKYFKYSFGVTVPEEKPIEITLSFNPFQGNYIKALPIHGSQKELLSNSDEYRISINIIPSYEFYSKILSYGRDVEVISPPEIREEVKKRIDSTALLYK